MSEELKTCPFCRGENLVTHETAVWWVVVCDNAECQTGGPVGETRREAIAAWNTRHQYAVERIAGELAEALRKYDDASDTWKPEERANVFGIVRRLSAAIKGKTPQ